jgi:RNA polymerase sigma factor FliA
MTDWEAWRLWKEASNERDRETAFAHFAWIARKVACSVPNLRPQDREDCEQDARVGLVRALDSFDPAMGYELTRYLQLKARYSLTDGIRGRSWVGKSTFGRAKALETAEQEWTAANGGRTPTEAELAEHVGLTVDELAKRRSQVEATPWQIHSLDAPVEKDEGGGICGDVVDTRADTEAEVLETFHHEELRRVLARLTPRERKVLVEVFFSGAQQRTIAAEIGRHESRVSQVAASALKKCRRLAQQVPLEL